MITVIQHALLDPLCKYLLLLGFSVTELLDLLGAFTGSVGETSFPFGFIQGEQEQDNTGNLRRRLIAKKGNM